MPIPLLSSDVTDIVNDQQFAIENGPVEIVDLPINSMVDLSSSFCEQLSRQVIPILPSGKLAQNYGKSPCLMGQLTISTGQSSSSHTVKLAW